MPRREAPQGRRRSLIRTLELLLLLTTPYMLWKLACILTGSSSPCMVVTSNSMAPAFFRGDMILLSNRKLLVEVGDIPVCWFSNNPLPMVHRAIEVYNVAGDEITNTPAIQQHILTKGDNNELTDEPLYPTGQLYVQRHQVVGLVRWYVPYVGWPVILLNTYPWIRGLAILLASITVLMSG